MDILKHIVELVGTFFFVYVVLKVSSNSTMNPTIGALTVALTLLVMIVIGGYITGSGAHLNPAITVASAVGGSIDMAHLLGYVIMQVLGALLAFRLFQMTK